MRSPTGTIRQDVTTVVRQAFQPDSELDKVRLESLTYSGLGKGVHHRQFTDPRK
jgi:hypothetical protein